MQSKQIEAKEKELNSLYRIADKLEQRIFKLEKVLESHAKCIGELREDKNEWDEILPRSEVSSI